MKFKYSILILFFIPFYLQAQSLSMTGMIFRGGTDRQELLYRQAEDTYAPVKNQSHCRSYAARVPRREFTADRERADH